MNETKHTLEGGLARYEKALRSDSAVERDSAGHLLAIAVRNAGVRSVMPALAAFDAAQPDLKEPYRPPTHDEAEALARAVREAVESGAEAREGGLGMSGEPVRWDSETREALLAALNIAKAAPRGTGTYANLIPAHLIETLRKRLEALGIEVSG